MIDWKRVADLQREIGPSEFSEVVSLFIEEVEGVIGRLRENPDPAGFEEDLHFLKGCAINLGFEDLANRCRAGETIAARGNADSVDLERVFSCYSDSRDAFFSGMAAGLAA